MHELTLTRRAWPIDEWCRAYGIGRTKAYAEIKAGRLKAVKVDRKTLIRTDDGETWLANLEAIA